MPQEFRAKFKADFWQLRQEHGIWGEAKWNKVSPSGFAFYCALVDYFFNQEELSFRAIVIDTARLDLARYHQSDAELGFYKFYYQLLTHWIRPDARYRIFCDDKVNRDTQRLPELRRVLANANRSAEIVSLEAVSSHQVAAVQLCDLLIGATQWRFNSQGGTSRAKSELVSRIESHTGRRISRTAYQESKFNIFEIRLEESRP